MEWTSTLAKLLDPPVCKHHLIPEMLLPFVAATHDAFYTNANIIAAFEKYIAAWVARYKNEPTIMAWELANEPRCTGSTGGSATNCDPAGSTINAWASKISAYIKSIDPNHLVGLGDEGWFQEANPPTYPYAPGVGIDFVKNLAITTLDFGTVHSYPEVRHPLLSTLMSWY